MHVGGGGKKLEQVGLWPRDISAPEDPCGYWSFESTPSHNSTRYMGSGHILGHEVALGHIEVMKC